MDHVKAHPLLSFVVKYFSCIHFWSLLHFVVREPFWSSLFSRYKIMIIFRSLSFMTLIWFLRKHFIRNIFFVQQDIESALSRENRKARKNIFRSKNIHEQEPDTIWDDAACCWAKWNPKDWWYYEYFIRNSFRDKLLKFSEISLLLNF